MADQDPIELDGRTLEGGGQLIRIALCLSALTSKPIKITNIRGNRSGGGGLKAQHLACVKWLAHACNAHVEGAEKGSKTLLFKPGRIEGGLSPAFKKVDNDHYECTLDIGTAGSTGLALQAILPYILFSRRPSNLPVSLKLSGGTNVSGSPSFDYINQVLLPTLHRIGFPEMKATLNKRGWSQGGTSIGNWTLEIPPRENLVLPAFKYQPPTSSQKPDPPTHIHATLLAPVSCHEHFRRVIHSPLQHHFPSLSSTNLTIECIDSHHQKRLYLLLTATSSYTLARDWLHERKSPSPERAVTEMAERVTAQLADEWNSGAWVDEHMRDQLVIFQALAEGRSEVYPGVTENGELREPSLHARTAEWVCRQMLGVRFDSEGICEGVAFGEDAQSEDGVETVAKKLEDLDVG